jgi:hypothetical protein
MLRAAGTPMSTVAGAHPGLIARAQTIDTDRHDTKNENR